MYLYADLQGGRILLVAATLAFGVSALATLALRRLAPRFGLVDRANPRSSHVGEVPCGGGLGVLVGAAAGLALAGVAFDLAFAVVLAGSLVLAAAGLLDDRGGLSPFVRLGLHVATAIALIAVTGGIERLPFPPPLDIPLGALGGAIAVVWIVAVVNFYNFLDGIDGLAGLQAAVTGTGIALVAWEPGSAALGACLAGAALGFLLHNWAPARIFLGDVGSHFLGFCFAAAPFLTPPESRPAAIGFVALSLFLFLADASWTLIARVARGERWYEAHREHAYQRLVSGGWSHARTTLALGAASLVLTAIGLAAWRTGSHVWMWTGFALAVAAFGVELLLARRARRVASAKASTPVYQ